MPFKCNSFFWTSFFRVTLWNICVCLKQMTKVPSIYHKYIHPFQLLIRVWFTGAALWAKMPSSLSLRPPSPEVMTSRHFQVSWDTKSLQYVWSLETLHIGSLAAALLWDTLNDQTDAYFSSLYSFSFTHTSWVSVGLVMNNQINSFSFMLRPL